LRRPENKAYVLLLLAPAVAAVLLRKARDHLMPRRDPVLLFEEFYLQTVDGVSLQVRYMPGGDRGAVIVAHPAVTGQRYAPLVEMAEMLTEHFDVFTFDFRGHGGSGGRMVLNLEGPLEDLRTVISMVGSRGYPWIGAVGFSLGGMCAFIQAALSGGLDAVAAVGAPPLLPDIEPYRRWLPAWSLFLRCLGARFKGVDPGGPQPMDVAAGFPDIPLLVIHCGNEAFYSREDLEEMLEVLGGRAEFWVIDGAAHTELAGREQDLIEWLADKSLP
jgi:pimeloyl-ACP methyl ester carboxylesterase